ASDGFGLLAGLDPDDVEAVEVAHSLNSARKDLSMISVPWMTKVSSVEKEDQGEVSIRDLVNELADLFVIDDDHGGIFRHKRRDPGIVEISWTSPLRHRRS